MNFDPLDYPYASRRNVTYAANGMVCASQSLSAQAGLEILQKGGNAIDAAIAAAICETVVEPTGNGLGSDAFALVWVKGKLYGINGSGYAPAKINADKLKAKGITAIPKRGWEAVTVPGAVSAWAELHKKFGKLPFAELFQPAIHYAESGYPLSPIVGSLWKTAEKTFAEYKGNPAFAGFFSTFFADNAAPEIGSLVKMPDHAKTLKLLADSYGESFYRGKIAEAIVAFSNETGGYFTQEDLANYKASWVEPVSINYRGYDVWELPPNGHGIVALMALNILKGFNFDKRDSVDTLHKQMEAMKLAFSDGLAYVADPRYMKTKVSDLLSEEYAANRRSQIEEKAVPPQPGNPDCGGTVYLCAADSEGNMISYIQSNFMGFGSGIVVPGYGISLNNRCHGFSLDLESDNYLLPGKKPYHTIIPGFLTKGNTPIGPFGVMGGFMQPQGHVQVLMNTIDFGLNPQAALDAPRWQWTSGMQFDVEPAFLPEVIEALKARGHEITINPAIETFGRGQIIWRNNDGILVGGSEPRTDGVCAAW